MVHSMFPLPLFVTFRTPLPQKRLDFAKSAKSRNSYLASHKPAKAEQRVNLVLAVYDSLHKNLGWKFILDTHRYLQHNHADTFS